MKLSPQANQELHHPRHVRFSPYRGEVTDRGHGQFDIVLLDGVRINKDQS